MSDPVSQCVYCGNPLSEIELTTDHVIPTSRGGSNLPNNKAPACRSCNFDKAQLTAGEYLSMRDNREDLEAYKRKLHDEMSKRGQERYQKLHAPLPEIPPVPPPVHRVVRRAVGECIADLGYPCYCPVCAPQAHASLTQNLRRRTNEG